MKLEALRGVSVQGVNSRGGGGGGRYPKTLKTICANRSPFNPPQCICLYNSPVLRDHLY